MFLFLWFLSFVFSLLHPIQKRGTRRKKIKWGLRKFVSSVLNGLGIQEWVKQKALSSWNFPSSEEVRDKTINKYTKLVMRAMKKNKAKWRAGECWVLVSIFREIPFGVVMFEQRERPDQHEGAGVGMCGRGMLRADGVSTSLRGGSRLGLLCR